MDPLSIGAGVIAVLEAAGTILKICYHVRSGLRKVPWSLIRIIEEIRDLRNITEAIQSALDNAAEGGTCVTQHFFQAINGPLIDVRGELVALERRVLRVPIEDLVESRWKAVKQALVWELGEQETKEHIARLERCKASLNLAITSQNSVSLQNIERATISFNTRLNETFSRLETATNLISRLETDNRRKDLINWIAPGTPWESHATAMKLHQPGTGEWFRECVEYSDWVSGSYQVCWLSGSPGSGKTLLFAHTAETFASEVADSLGAKLFAFAYCDFRRNGTINPQTANSLLGSLLAQLCLQAEDFPPEILHEYQSANPGEQVKTASPRAQAIIGAILELSKQYQVTLFVDAVDEIEDREDFLHAIDTLTLYSSNIKVLATSRNEVQISSRFPGRTIHVDLDNKVQEVDQDISLYINGRLRSERNLAWPNPGIGDDISRALQAKSSGMFRWAQCQLDSIARARTIKEVRRTLDSLPQGLEETYNRILSQVSPADEILFRKLLIWLAFSYLPLTLEQLWEAVAIEPGTSQIDDESRLRSPQDLLSLGHSLISVTADGHVRLAHLSVRDHLLSEPVRISPTLSKFSLDPAEGHHQLAVDCLTYLGFEEFRKGPSSSDCDYCDRITKYPLARYAAMAWSYHLRSAQQSAPDDSLQSLATGFFSQESRNQLMSWVQLINADSPFKWNIYPRHATPLYYASSFGLDDVVRHLLSLRPCHNLNGPGSRFGGTALHAATIRNHISVMELLLAVGADPSRGDFNGVTPLHSAASQGNMLTIEVLLRHSAPLAARDALANKMPAEWAAMSGELDVAAFLNSEEKEQQKTSGSSPRSTGAFSDSGCSLQSSPSPEHRELSLWRPGQEYFPDIYDKRSGLWSSILVGIESNGKAQSIEPTFSPVISRCNSWGSTCSE